MRCTSSRFFIAPPRPSLASSSSLARRCGHRLLAALARRFLQPAHGQRLPADGANFHGNLVVRTADAAGLHLDHRLDVVQRDHEDLERILAGLLLDLVERAVDDALGDGLLARFHDDVHELGQVDRAELRVGQDLALGYFATTWHGTLPSVELQLAGLQPTREGPSQGPHLLDGRKAGDEGAARKAKTFRPSWDAWRRTSSATACGP
jgi:hypothetical protein